MQAEPPQPLPAKKEGEQWWETEEDRDSWLEFLAANKVCPNSADPPRILTHVLPQTLNFEYMMDNQPFEELPWQYRPKPKINHRPPMFVYGFPLESDISEIERIAQTAGILGPQEPLTGDNVTSLLPQTLRYLARECGLLRENSFFVHGCYCRSVRFVLELKTNYHLGRVPPEKLEHVIEVLKRYFPGKRPQWFLDPTITDLGRRNFEIPGSLCCQSPVVPVG